jgi:hypothetical protein
MSKEIFKKNIGKKIKTGAFLGIATVTTLAGVAGCGFGHEKNTEKTNTPTPKDVGTTTINSEKVVLGDAAQQAIADAVNKAFDEKWKSMHEPERTHEPRRTSEPTTVPSAVVPEALKTEYGNDIVVNKNQSYLFSKGTVISIDAFVNGNKDFDDDGATGALVVFNSDSPLEIHSPYGGSGKTNLKNQAEIDATVSQQAMASLGSHPEFNKIMVYDALTGKQTAYAVRSAAGVQIIPVN